MVNIGLLPVLFPGDVDVVVGVGPHEHLHHLGRFFLLGPLEKSLSHTRGFTSFRGFF